MMQPAVFTQHTEYFDLQYKSIAIVSLKSIFSTVLKFVWGVFLCKPFTQSLKVALNFTINYEGGMPFSI